MHVVSGSWATPRKSINEERAAVSNGHPIESHAFASATVHPRVLLWYYSLRPEVGGQGSVRRRERLHPMDSRAAHPLKSRLRAEGAWDGDWSKARARARLRYLVLILWCDGWGQGTIRLALVSISSLLVSSLIPFRRRSQSSLGPRLRGRCSTRAKKATHNPTGCGTNIDQARAATPI